MAFQPASAHLPTRVVATGAFTTAVVSQNFLRASTRSKTSLTQIDSLRASYPLKLLSPASANTTFLDPAARDEEEVNSDTKRPSSPSAASTTSSTIAASRRPALPPPPRIVYMITYGGGLLADDHPDLQFVLQRHARLLILGQGNTKIYKSPKPNHPPASQTLHSTVAPGAFLLFLGPAVVACEDSSVFLRHEILLQAQRPRRIEGHQHQSNERENEDEELPNCVVLDWIAGGRGEDERWKARRSEWRLVIRWAELEPEVVPGSSSASSTAASSSSHGQKEAQSTQANKEAEEEEEEDEYVEEEDPRDVADRLAGGPVVFRDGFLIEHNAPLPSKKSSPITTPAPGSPAPSSASPLTTSTVAATSAMETQTITAPASTLKPKLTSYAPSLYPHSTIGSLFIMGPKTRRLQQSILKRFERLTIYPGQKPEQRADYPILWSVTVVQVPRPPGPNQGAAAAHTRSVPRRKYTKMNAMVVKMASQGIEQMQDFLKSLFEEVELDSGKKMMDSSEDEEDEVESRGRASKGGQYGQDEDGLSVIEELFGGRTVWERVFR